MNEKAGFADLLLFPVEVLLLWVPFFFFFVPSKKPFHFYTSLVENECYSLSLFLQNEFCPIPFVPFIGNSPFTQKGC